MHVQQPMGYGQPGELPESLTLCDGGLLPPDERPCSEPDVCCLQALAMVAAGLLAEMLLPWQASMGSSGLVTSLPSSSRCSFSSRRSSSSSSSNSSSLQQRRPRAPPGTGQEQLLTRASVRLFAVLLAHCRSGFCLFVICWPTAALGLDDTQQALPSPCLCSCKRRHVVEFTKQAMGTARPATHEDRTADNLVLLLGTQQGLPLTGAAIHPPCMWECQQPSRPATHLPLLPCCRCQKQLRSPV